MGVASPDEIAAMRERSINTILKRNNLQRQKQWTESIAVGSESVVDTVKDKLGIRAKTRTVHQDNDNYQLREVVDPYNTIFHTENEALSEKNSLFWNVYL